MRFVLFLYIFLCYTLSSLTGQEITRQQVPILPSNLLKYYSLIDSAEISIVNNNQAQALKYYTLAFKIFPQGFLEDYENAYILASETKNLQSISELASHLIQIGACKELFFTYPHMMDSLFFEQFYKTNAKKSKINKEYEQSLIELMELDQKVRQDGSSKEEITIVDSINYLRFKEIVKSNGFPSINNMGYNCSYNNNGFDRTIPYILLIHFSNRRLPGCFEMLTEALINGELKNEIYLDIINSNGMKDRPLYAIHPIICFNGSYYEDISYDYNPTVIDQNRKLIGICKYQDKLKKISYNFKPQKSKCKIFYNMLSFNMIPDERMLKALKPIDIYKL